MVSFKPHPETLEVILHITVYFIHRLVTEHLTLLFHIQPSPLKAKKTQKESKLEYSSLKSQKLLVECGLTIQGWQMEMERGVMRKRASIQPN